MHDRPIHTALYPDHSQTIKAQQPRRIDNHVRSPSATISLFRQTDMIAQNPGPPSPGSTLDGLRIPRTPHQLRRAYLGYIPLFFDDLEKEASAFVGHAVPVGAHSLRKVIP
jgi:hypothetical protein